MEPIKIVREVPLTQKANYIDEIKHIRQYTADRYGVHCGLKEAKSLIDSVQMNQKEPADRVREEISFLRGLFDRYCDEFDYTVNAEDFKLGVREFLDRV